MRKELVCNNENIINSEINENSTRDQILAALNRITHKQNHYKERLKESEETPFYKEEIYEELAKLNSGIERESENTGKKLNKARFDTARKSLANKCGVSIKKLNELLFKVCDKEKEQANELKKAKTTKITKKNNPFTLAENSTVPKDSKKSRNQNEPNDVDNRSSSLDSKRNSSKQHLFTTIDKKNMANYNFSDISQSEDDEGNFISPIKQYNRKMIKATRIRSDSDPSIIDLEDDDKQTRNAVAFKTIFDDIMFEEAAENHRSNADNNEVNVSNLSIINETSKINTFKENLDQIRQQEMDDLEKKHKIAVKDLQDNKPLNTIEFKDQYVKWENQFTNLQNHYEEEKQTLIDKHKADISRHTNTFNEQMDVSDNSSQNKHSNTTSSMNQPQNDPVQDKNTSNTVSTKESETVRQLSSQTHSVNNILKNININKLFEKSNDNVTINVFEDLNSTTRRQAIRDNELQKSYPMEDHCVLLFGPKLLEFAGDHYKMTSEIKKVKKVDDPKHVDLEACSIFNDRPCIRVITSSREDYLEMLKPWPKNAFGGGVIPKPGLLSFQMVIEHTLQDIQDPNDPSKKIKEQDPFEDKRTIRHLQCLGLFQPQRYGKKGNKVRVFVQNLTTLVDRTSDETIQIGNKRRKIKPIIKAKYWCDNCGQFGYHMNCSYTKACLICSINFDQDQDHKFNNCGNTPCCINCKQNHPTNSIDCRMWMSKIIEDNDYVATLLVGEGIIGSKSKILKYVNPRIKTDHLMHGTGNNETNPDQIRQICMDIIKPMQVQLDKNKIDIEEQRDMLNKVKIQITDLGEKMDNKVDALDKSLTNKVENLEKTCTIRFDTFEKAVSAKMDTVEKTLENATNTMTTNIQAAQFSIIGSIENLFKAHSLNTNKASSSTPSASTIGQLQNNNLTPNTTSLSFLNTNIPISPITTQPAQNKKE